MRAADAPDNFRGPAMPALARRSAREDMIDAEIISAVVSVQLYVETGLV